MIVTTVTNCAPHPIKATFTSNGGPLLIQFHGSAWSPQKSSGIGANLLLDGAVIATAQAFTNEANSHKALVLVNVFTCSVRAGTHTFTVEAALSPDTKIDQNDFFTITVIEYQVS